MDFYFLLVVDALILSRWVFIWVRCSPVQTYTSKIAIAVIVFQAIIYGAAEHCEIDNVTGFNLIVCLVAIILWIMGESKYKQGLSEAKDFYEIALYGSAVACVVELINGKLIVRTHTESLRSFLPNITVLVGKDWYELFRNELNPEWEEEYELASKGTPIKQDYCFWIARNTYIAYRLDPVLNRTGKPTGRFVMQFWEVNQVKTEAINATINQMRKELFQMLSGVVNE